MSALSAAASKEDGDTIKNLQARVADLEAQLYAVGAGGVGKMEQPQVEQPTMTNIAQRKLNNLLTRGYTISGYSVYHESKHQHGFVTTAGMVGWWKPEGVEYPQPPRQPLTKEEIAVIAAACGGLASDFVVSIASAVEVAHGIGGEK